MPSITTNPLPYTHRDATALRAAQQLEIATLRPTGFGIPATAANVPIFLVASDELEPIGCGGLRPLFVQRLPRQTEVKSMYVVPERRGKVERGVVVAEAISEE